MTDIFITGSHSFVGKQLIKKLSNSIYNIICVDINEKNSDNFINADICDPKIDELIPQNSIVVHLAAISKPSICDKNLKLAFDVNVNGTINLYNAAKKKNVKNFIFSSSEWVYDQKNNKSNLFDEHSLIDISNINSVLPYTKIVAEKYLKIHKSTVPVNILRFGIIYGPREEDIQHWSAVDYIFHQIKYKNEIEVGSLNTSRCFIHVEDIVDGIIAVLENNSSNLYNISGSKLISLNEIINLSSLILNKSPNIIEKNSLNSSVRGASNNYAIKNLNWYPKIDLKNGLISLNKFLNSEFYKND